LFRWRSGVLPVEIVGVVSNHPDLRSLVEWHQIPFHHLPVTAETRPAQEAQILELISRHQVDLLVLARYMQILSNDLCRKLSGRCINIHHSFLPSFKGARPYHQAYARGVKIIGATAHYVTADLDEGPIIEQAVERVGHEHTPERFQEIGRDLEAIVLARAVRWHAERRILLDGQRSVILS
jgi:formyltetrahydrofolate deformylase